MKTKKRVTKTAALYRPKKKRKTKKLYRRNPESFEPNPSAKTSTAKRYARRAGGRLLAGINLKSAIREGVPTIAGMFLAKGFARKWGGGTETDPTTWTWGTYAKAIVGTVGGAMAANMIRPGTGQRVLNGGMAFVLFKIVQNELITKSEKMSGWFGEDLPELEGYGNDPNILQLDGDGNPWMMSSDGTMIPVDERHRMMGEDDIEDGGTWGDALVTPGPLGKLGEVLVTPGRLGTNERENYIERYRLQYQNR